MSSGRNTRQNFQLTLLISNPSESQRLLVLMPIPLLSAIWCAFCRSLCVETVIIWPTFRAAIRLISEVLFFIAQTMARLVVCCPERNAKYFIDRKRKVGLTTRMSLEKTAKPIWTIEYNNDTGPRDEGFREWWIVTNGTLRFRCDQEIAARWLQSRLNSTHPTIKL